MFRKSKKLINKKIEIHKSKISRYGIFAGEDIKNGEHILMTAEQIKEWAFINHSCQANAWLRTSKHPQTDNLFAIKNIKMGEEITYDYRDTRWAEQYYYNRIENKPGGCRCPSCFKK